MKTLIRFQADDKSETSSKGGPGDKGLGDDEAAQREISALKVGRALFSRIPTAS